jgi:hypothetical protein
MKNLLLILLTLSTVPSYAASLIECDGIDNPNTGIVRIVTNEKGDVAKKALVASFNQGTAFHHLSDVNINKNNSALVDHTDRNGSRLLIELTKEQLTDGSNTIRPFYFKSRVYFEVAGQKTLINSRFLKCRVFNNL